MTLAGPMGPILVVAAGGALVALRRRAAHRARRARLAAAVPDAVELLVLTVQAGVVPADAVRRAIPHLPEAVRPAFAAVVHRLDRGQRLADALDALGEHLGAAGHGIADGIATADRYGLPLAPVLDQLAVDARAARRRLAAEHARTLPVRLSFPLVCCVLPAFVLLAIAPALLGTVASLRTGLP
jgi:tight adherence protein C